MEVTVTDVTKNNFTTLWPAISFAVKTASFIAIDLVRFILQRINIFKCVVAADE